MADNDEKIFIDFDPNDYIIRLTPFFDDRGEWTGELMVGCITTDDNTVSDDDHYHLMGITQMICAAVPAIEESEEVRNTLMAIRDRELADDSQVVEEEPTPKSRINGVSGNVIKATFH
tara:strand:+ start:8118 stop:8471 length:354 start_codon:yes stop_codon:yes gene_type:complete